MFRDRIGEECPDKGHGYTSAHSGQSVRAQEVDGIVLLSIGSGHLLSNLTHLELIPHDHRGRDDGDDSNYTEAENLDRYVENARQEDEEKYDNSRGLLPRDIPCQKTEHHGQDRTEETENEAEYALPGCGRHTEVDHDHGPNESLLDKEVLRVMKERNHGDGHRGTCNSEAIGRFGRTQCCGYEANLVTDFLQHILRWQVFRILSVLISLAQLKNIVL